MIYSLVKTITIHNHKHKNKWINKNDIANTKKYCNVLTQHIHFIPYVHTIMDYNDEYAIYH